MGNAEIQAPASNPASTPTVAVLAVQGAFIEHEQRLQQLGAECFELRQAADLERPFDALVLPGGESTVQAHLLRELGMLEPLRKKIEAGTPVLGTCAGLILLAGAIDQESGDMGGRNQELAQKRTRVEGLGTMPITVRRNAYGRQLASFHTQGAFAEREVPMTFIRAPFITQVEDGVKVLSETEGCITGVQYGKQIGIAFHPELDDDTFAYEYFLGLIG